MKFVSHPQQCPGPAMPTWEWNRFDTLARRADPSSGIISDLKYLKFGNWPPQANSKRFPTAFSNPLICWDCLDLVLVCGISASLSVCARCGYLFERRPGMQSRSIEKQFSKQISSTNLVGCPPPCSFSVSGSVCSGVGLCLFVSGCAAAVGLRLFVSGRGSQWIL